MTIGYSPASTDEHGLAVQRDELVALGVPAKRVQVDHGPTGTDRDRPGCARRWPPVAPATRWWSPSLDRLARSVPDARAIGDELTAGEVKPNLGGAVYDPTDPVGRLLFNALAMVTAFLSATSPASEPMLAC